MEMKQIEVAAPELTVEEAIDKPVKELGDLQLALVGGGIGSVIFA